MGKLSHETMPPRDSVAVGGGGDDGDVDVCLGETESGQLYMMQIHSKDLLARVDCAEQEIKYRLFSLTAHPCTHLPTRPIYPAR